MKFKEGFALIIREHLENTEQIKTMAIKDLKKQYSGTILSYFWSVLKNVIFVFAYWFTIVIGLKSERTMDVPYMVWLSVGLVPWFFIRDTLVPSAKSIRTYRYLVTKVIFPKSIIPTFKTLSGFLGSMMFLGVVFVLCLVYGVFPTIYWIQLIYYGLAILLLMIVLSLTTSALVVMSRDIEFLLNSSIVLLFWLTPILWGVENLSSPLSFIIKLNPFYYVINGFRESMINGVWFWEHPMLTLYYWMFMCILMVLGVVVHTKTRNSFADIL